MMPFSKMATINLRGTWMYKTAYILVPSCRIVMILSPKLFSPKHMFSVFKVHV